MHKHEKHTLAGTQVVDLTQCEEESKQTVELVAGGDDCTHNNTTPESRTRGYVHVHISISLCVLHNYVSMSLLMYIHV